MRGASGRMDPGFGRESDKWFASPRDAPMLSQTLRCGLVPAEDIWICDRSGQTEQDRFVNFYRM